jgi:hypothetical protein
MGVLQPRRLPLVGSSSAAAAGAAFGAAAVGLSDAAGIDRLSRMEPSWSASDRAFTWAFVAVVLGLLYFFGGWGVAGLCTLAAVVLALRHYY